MADNVKMFWISLLHWLTPTPKDERGKNWDDMADDLIETMGDNASALSMLPHLVKKRRENGNNTRV